jgi:glycosyltransferase involved in cell wall biosynthesis
MRVLLLADACNPEWPSLPVVGYKYAKALAEQASVHVVTQVRNRPNIEKAGLGNARVTYLDTEPVARPIYKAAMLLRRGDATGWTIQMAMDYPSYIAFELYALRQFKKELMAGAYDIVHRITPMSPTLPSAMARSCPVPFVLGPLNGNLAWPAQFREEKVREREWLSVVRDAYKLLPFYRSTYAKPRAILAAFRHTLADLPRAALPRAIDFPEVGIDPELFSKPQRPARSTLTVLYAGRLVPYKLPDVPVRAFAASPSLRKHRLVVIGDGPEREMIERVVTEEKLGDCVEVLGRKSQAEVAEWMRTADIFAFPSIRELGAGVVVEAMACGMASVVVDYGGPGTLIGSDRGVKLPLGTKAQLIDSMRVALEAMVRDPAHVKQLGENAHAYAMQYYPWQVKARKTLEIYDWVLGRRSQKPDFYSA